MYCVNGQAPYFKTVQEARVHALASKDQWLMEVRQDGLLEALADIYDDNGELVGTVLRPPAEWRDVESGHGARPEGIYYLKNGATNIQFLNTEDGSLAPEIVNLNIKAENNRFIIPSPMDGNLPFTSIEDARAFLYRIFSSPDAVIGGGTPILSREGKVMGFVLKHDANTVIYGENRRWHEVRPNGRLGKTIRVRYGGPTGPAVSFPVDWECPRIVEKDHKGAQ